MLPNSTCLCRPLNCRTLFSEESKPPYINIYRPAVRSSRSVSLFYASLQYSPLPSRDRPRSLLDTPNIKISARQTSKIYKYLTLAIQKITSCIVKKILHVPSLAVVFTPQTPQFLPNLNRNVHFQYPGRRLVAVPFNQ